MANSGMPYFFTLAKKTERKMSSSINNRREMIDRLVEHSVETAMSESSFHWLKDVFERGFLGYTKLSNGQLMMEMQLRGLISAHDTIEDEADDEPDDDRDNEQLLNDIFH
jgi:hypothetical protein